MTSETKEEEEEEEENKRMNHKMTTQLSSFNTDRLLFCKIYNNTFKRHWGHSEH